jgi:hypothetical protein
MRVAVVDLDQAQAELARAGALNRSLGLAWLRSTGWRGRSASLTCATACARRERIRAWRRCRAALRDLRIRTSCVLTRSPSTETITS